MVFEQWKLVDMLYLVCKNIANEIEIYIFECINYLVYWKIFVLMWEYKYMLVEYALNIIFNDS